MQEIRYAMVDGEKVPVLISDENEALQAAKAARRAIVGLWREDGKENEWCADTLITDVEDADEEFLERIARRHLGLPWTICETERLILREIAERDYEEIVKIMSMTVWIRRRRSPDTRSATTKCLSLDSGRSRKKRAETSPVLWDSGSRRMMRPGMWKTGFCLLTMKIAWMTRWNSDTISFRNIGDRGMRKRHVWRLLNMRKRNSEQFSFSHGSKRIISCRRRWRRDLDS